MQYIFLFLGSVVLRGQIRALKTCKNTVATAMNFSMTFI